MQPAACPPADPARRAFAAAQHLSRHFPAHVREDARAAALLAWTEARSSHDPLQGALSTWTWLRMRGEVIDEMRRQEKHFRRRSRAVHSGDRAIGGRISEQLAVSQAVGRALPQMDPTERAVLEGVYRDGAALVEIAADTGKSADSVQRAHQRMLRRLRAELASGQPAPQAN